MAESGYIGWRGEDLVAQLQIACGMASSVGSASGVLEAVRAAVESFDWGAATQPEFVTARAVLLTFLSRATVLSSFPDDMVRVLGGLGSASGEDIRRRTEFALRYLAPTPRISAPEADRRVVRALASIRKDPQNPRVTDLARAVGLSRWHLERLVKSETGKALRAHIVDARLTRAESLLRQDLSIKEVSALAGFPHPNAFRRDFKRKYGMTPTLWVVRQSTV